MFISSNYIFPNPVFFNLFPTTKHFVYLKNLAEHQEKIKHILNYLLLFSYFSVMFGPALRSINLEFGKELTEDKPLVLPQQLSTFLVF